MNLKKRTIILTIIAAGILYAAVSILALLNSVRITVQAREEVSHVIEAVQAEQFDRALSSLFVIEDSLSRARAWQRPSGWIKLIPVIRHDYIVYGELLSAGSQLSTSFKYIVLNLSQGNISQQLSLETLDLRTAPAAYLEIHDDVMDSLDSLLEAADSAQNLHLTFIPEQYQDELIQLQEKLLESKEMIKAAKTYLELVPFLLGQSDPHEMLILLQNPHELRPTGGFIGTYGRVSLANGSISQFFTDDIYNLDVKALGREELPPPSPLQTYSGLEYWYLRDANWSPDYPNTAQDIKRLYEFESGDQDIDTIVAITPFLVEEFLRIIGPVEVDNIVFNADNLIDAIQYRVEQEFWRIGLTDEERKSVINNLAQVLKQRLFTMNKDEIKLLWQAAQKALDQREILVYTTNPPAQAFIAEQGWDGRIIDVKTDYLYVVDANVGALKTDRLVDRTRNYSISKQLDNRWKARLELTYKNNGFFDYRTTRYRTYTRVYIPIGSELISTSGFMKTDKSNEFVLADTYTEFDKKVIAGFLSVEPDQQRTIVIEYYLPPWLQNDIDANNKYQLYIQKQPGVRSQDFTGSVTARKDLFSFAPSEVSYQLEGDRSIRFQDELVEDREFVVKFDTDDFIN